jgi:hypothetical protein
MAMGNAAVVQLMDKSKTTTVVRGKWKFSDGYEITPSFPFLKFAVRSFVGCWG